MADDSEFHDFYKYTPSKAAAIVFIVLFLITSCAHLFQLIKGRVWFYIPLVVGGLFEVIGYSARIVSSTQAPLFTDTPYIIQTLFLLLAPALFAASVYMELGRIVILLDGEQHTVIRRTWMTKIFVAGDVLSFIVQGMGGGIMSGGSEPDTPLGENIIIAGLAIQLLFFGFFIFVSFVFHGRMNMYPTTPSLSSSFPWKRHIFALYTVSVLVMLRSIFRIAEFIEGSEGELLGHEIYLYLFDAALMCLLMVILNVVHPGVISVMLKDSERLKARGDPEGAPEEIGLTRPARRHRSRTNTRPSLSETSYARHAIATRGLA